MPQQVTKVRLFVASPGDVQRERESLDSVVRELNRVLGKRLQCFIELVLWETHCYPAMGRPQGVINEQIATYDIFLGIMWKRFGSPTGIADSGTEEEFNRAYEAWEVNNRLNILFYFSKAPYFPRLQSELDQNSKVLDFKNKLQNKGLVWDYDEPNVFGDTVRPHLAEILSEMFPKMETSIVSREIIDRPASPNEALDEQPQHHEDLNLSVTPTAERQSGKQQITECIGALERLVEQENFPTGFRFDGHPDYFQLLRLHLLTTTWLASDIPNSMLGIQETNQLYLAKERLYLTTPESISLLRAMIADSFSYLPGWYWFRVIEEEGIEVVMLDLALTDPQVSVRKGAFTLLSSCRAPLPDWAVEHLAWTVTSDQSPEVRAAALAYIGVVGGDRYLPMIGSALVDRESAVSIQAKASKYLLLARTEPDRAVSELLSEIDIKVKDILDELLRNSEQIVTDTLYKALVFNVNYISIDDN